MKAYLIGLICFGFGLGFGGGTVFMLTEATEPAIVIEEKWRTITTAPPPAYEAETPFHIDPKVVCPLPPPPQVVKEYVYVDRPIVVPTQPKEQLEPVKTEGNGVGNSTSTLVP